MYRISLRACPQYAPVSHTTQPSFLSAALHYSYLRRPQWRSQGGAVGGDRPTSVVNTSLCSKTKEIRARYRSGLLMSKNAFAAGAPPRTPPEELTALPRPPRHINIRGLATASTDVLVLFTYVASRHLKPHPSYINRRTRLQLSLVLFVTEIPHVCTSPL